MSSRRTPERLSRLAPGLAVLRTYQRGWLRVDLVAGLTVGAMLIPQSMAYAELAGMPPEYGFYAVIGTLVVYALVGTSRHLGVGPEPGTAILAATGVARSPRRPGRYVALMAALALVVGGSCSPPLARLGFLASVLSKPVLVGYITGVGLTLLSSQIAAFTGVPIEADRFFPRFGELFRELDDVDPARSPSAGASLPRAGPAASGPARARRPARGRRWPPSWRLSRSTSRRRAGRRDPEGLPRPGCRTCRSTTSARCSPWPRHRARRIHRQRAHRPLDRRPARLPDRREPGVGGARPDQPDAGVSQGFPVSSSASRTAVSASLGSKTQLVSIVASAWSS